MQPKNSLFSRRQAAARVGALSRSRSESDPEYLAARRDLRASQLAEHIARAVAEAPPLTDEQRDCLATLLRGEAA